MSGAGSSSLNHLSSSDYDPITGELTGYECTCEPSEIEVIPEPVDVISEESDDDDDDEDEVKSVVSLWNGILQQSEEKLAPLKEWEEEQNALVPVVPYQDGPAEYLNREIFPLLLPAMEDMLLQARQWKALYIQKCRFNGLDFLAEVLWNRNPRHPRRALAWLDLFSIPPFKLWLRLHPRPIFPMSWMWTEEEAALIIQKWVRGWLVRKRDDVQEMRQFWKAIIAEQEDEARLEAGESNSNLDATKRRRKDKKVVNSCEHFKTLGHSRPKPF